ncbi:MAG: RNA polymerase subunit sigma-70 [Flavobacteriaceae bacterium]|nr:RNA polymerase subunit sigma-70 [Flavobacteriaceae bacterium]|tara:strand:+ start:1760 stop:2308 length:549 start_codon:yes stop_codon:yes gene_type:complete
MEEKNLIIKAKKNDQKAFQILFDNNWKYLYNFQLKKTGNPQIAEEVSIKTFTKAFDKLNSYDSKYSFKTWLLTISKNLLVDQIRKEKSFKKSHSETNLNIQIVDRAPSPEEGMIINQNLDEILKAIKSLKPEYRRILQLRFFDDQTYNSISTKLNQPLNTIKVKLFRAKRLLAEILEKNDEV